jgi:large subunit ribosomal protein L16
MLEPFFIKTMIYMLQPKQTRFKKVQKGRTGGIIQHSLHFGSFGIQCLVSIRLNAKVIEAVRRAISKRLNRQGKIWIRVFPDIPVSKKPAEVRMGKGKGSISHWICRVQKGQMLFEFDGISKDLAIQATIVAQQKLPFKTLFVCET